MRFHLVGLNTTGVLLSYHLRRILPVEHTVAHIYSTRRQAEDALTIGSIHVERDGLVDPVRDFDVETFRSPLLTAKRSRDTEGSSSSSQIESLFVTANAHHTLPIMRALLPRLSPDCTIVLLQSGLGVYERLIQNVFRNPMTRPHFILASSSHSAFTTKTLKVVHSRVGELEFGIVPDPAGRNFEAGFTDESVPKMERVPRLSDISGPWSSSSSRGYESLKRTVAALMLMQPLNVSWKPIADVQTILRRKLVVDAVVQPLAALMGCRNGELFEAPETHPLKRRICKEAEIAFIAQHMQENGDWQEPTQGKRFDFSDEPPNYFPLALQSEMLEEAVAKHVEETKTYISPMLTDIRRGAHTEVDFLNGYLVGLGSVYGVHTPLNLTLVQLVKMRGSIPLDQML